MDLLQILILSFHSQTAPLLRSSWSLHWASPSLYFVSHRLPSSFTWVLLLGLHWVFSPPSVATGGPRATPASLASLPRALFLLSQGTLPFAQITCHCLERNCRKNSSLVTDKSELGSSPYLGCKCSNTDCPLGEDNSRFLKSCQQEVLLGLSLPLHQEAVGICFYSLG